MVHCVEIKGRDDAGKIQRRIIAPAEIGLYINAHAFGGDWNSKRSVVTEAIMHPKYLCGKL